MSNSMTIRTFRAGARRLPYAEGCVECQDAADFYEQGDTKPTALWVYPGGVWLAELGTGGVCELYIGADYWVAGREELETYLHEWAVQACGLKEPHAKGSAGELYEQRTTEVAALSAAIVAKLHEEPERLHWGHAGDAGHVLDLVRDAAAFLGVLS